ncbi:hypothetical protein BH09ACT1_BH09ACT1_09080 [soil metagenome]
MFRIMTFWLQPSSRAAHWRAGSAWHPENFGKLREGSRIRIDSHQWRRQSYASDQTSAARFTTASTAGPTVLARSRASAPIIASAACTTIIAMATAATNATESVKSVITATTKRAPLRTSAYLEESRDELSAARNPAAANPRLIPALISVIPAQTQKATITLGVYRPPSWSAAARSRLRSVSEASPRMTAQTFRNSLQRVKCSKHRSAADRPRGEGLLDLVRSVETGTTQHVSRHGVERI